MYNNLITSITVERTDYTRTLYLVKTYGRVRKLAKIARKLIKHLGIYFSSPRI